MNKRICFASLFLLIATFLVLGSAAAMADTVVYNNGAPNGNDAWTINFGFWVEDSFTLTTTGNLTQINFAAWLIPGDVIQTVRWTIFSAGAGAGGGGPILRSGTAVVTSGASCGTDCLEETFSLPSLHLTPGTYYLRLQNAVVTNGDPAYWAESGGPSKAYQSTAGSIPSESFQVIE
jgi:hypothetical protein